MATEVRFQVLTAKITLVTTVFWDVALCILLEVHRRFRAHLPDDGDSKHF